MRNKKSFAAAAFNVATAATLATAYDSSLKTGHHTLALIAAAFAVSNAALAVANVGLGLWGNRASGNTRPPSQDHRTLGL